ncbi:MAG: hypothetical protein PVF17_10105 [Ignavibacteria bacterium]|jgi:hypothetical protein
MKNLNKIIILSIFILLSISCSEDAPTNTQQPEAAQLTINLLNEIDQTFTPGEAIDNPISIQVLDELGEPVADVMVTFQVTGGNGELLLNSERSLTFSLNTDSSGKAEIEWIPGNGIDNLITISAVETDRVSDPMIVCALVQENNKVVLVSFKWLETSEFQFPYIFPPYSIDYDGRILESNHFLVFSDESSDDIKIDFAALAEDALYKFKTAYEINYDDLGILDTDTKVMIYTCKNLYLDNPQQFSTDNSLLIYGKDSPRWNTWPGYSIEIYKNVLEHELTHVMQFRMGAKFELCESWFMEGTAEYMSDGVHTPITSNLEFSQWISHPDHTTNPIDAKSLNDLSVPLSRASEYYPAFHLAVKYLLESNDINRSVIDVKNMFFEIAATRDFTTAFENNFGISIEYFRDNYYELMIDFLNS